MEANRSFKTSLGSIAQDQLELYMTLFQKKRFGNGKKSLMTGALKKNVAQKRYVDSLRRDLINEVTFQWGTLKSEAGGCLDKSMTVTAVQCSC